MCILYEAINCTFRCIRCYTCERLHTRIYYIITKAAIGRESEIGENEHGQEGRECLCISTKYYVHLRCKLSGIFQLDELVWSLLDWKWDENWRATNTMCSNLRVCIDGLPQTMLKQTNTVDFRKCAGSCISEHKTD